MFSFFRYVLLALCIGLFFSCAKEKEWDYDYRIVNDMDDPVSLTYKLVSSPAEYTVSFPSKMDTIMISREGVVGHDIWNIESASLIYMFDKLDGLTVDSIYSDNLRLRSAWSGPENVEGRGVYTLHLTRDLFNTTLKKYEYRIKNASDKFVLHFSFQGDDSQVGELEVNPGNTSYIATYKLKSSKLENLYSDKKIANIVGLKLTSLAFIGADGAVSSANRHSANLRQYWEYSEEVNPRGERIGVYTQTLDEKICDNRTILETDLFSLQTNN